MSESPVASIAEITNSELLNYNPCIDWIYIWFRICQQKRWLFAFVWN